MAELSPLVLAEGLGKELGGRWLFRGVTFELGAGDVLLLIGPNGSGKSTLLKVVSGLVAPSLGTVTRPELNRVGFTALDQSLYSALTPREHLELAAQLRGVEPEADEWLRRMQLQAQAAQPTGTLSTGQRARLKLALALQARPDLLLMDEPSAALDDAGRALWQEALHEHRQTGATIIATNDKEDHRFGTCAITLGEPK